MNKRQTIFALTILVVIITELITVFSINSIKTDISNHLIDEYTDQEKIVGDQVSKTLVSEVNNIKNTLQIAMLDNDIRNGTRLCNDKLEKIVNASEYRIHNLGRVGKDGKFLCSVNAGIIGTSAYNLGQYISDIFNDPEHKPVMSRIVKVPNLGIYAIAVHFPVYDDSKNFIGTLGGAIYLDKIGSFLKDIQIGEGGYISLLDDNLDELYHPETDLIGQKVDSEKVLALLNNDHGFIDKVKEATNKQAGKYKYQFKGINKVAVFIPIEIFSGRVWVAVITLPLATAQKIVQDIQLDRDFNIISGTVTTGLILQSLILLLYITLTVLNPINKLTKSIKKISEGDLDEKIKQRRFKKNDEVDSLVNSFNIMAQKLRESMHGLEEKVKERTEELEKEKTSLEEKVERRTTDLSNANEDLEEKVEERTKELKDKIADLERLNHIMISRENRMLQLKQKLHDANIEIDEEEESDSTPPIQN